MLKNINIIEKNINIVEMYSLEIWYYFIENDNQYHLLWEKNNDMSMINNFRRF